MKESPQKTKLRIASRESQSSAQSLKARRQPILQLQRNLGNRRVLQLLKAKRLTSHGKILGLQGKLTVGAAHDPYEQEADQVAQQVLSMSNGAAVADIYYGAANGPGNLDLTAHELTHVVQQGKGTRYIQRDVLSHVDVEDANFWGTLKGEVKSDYGLWLGQFDRVFRGFVSIMDKETSVYTTSAWSTFRAWLQVGGQTGDIINALIETTDLMMSSLPEAKKLTFGELEKFIITDLNALTKRVRNTDSDLPLYKIIDSKQSEEQKVASGTRSDFRLSVRNELSQVLEKLPSPEEIKKELVLRWIKAEGDTDLSPATIVYGAEYDLRGESPKEVGFSEADLGTVQGPFIADVAKPKNTIEALKDAFGDDFLLHKMPLRFLLRIVARKPVKYHSTARILENVGSYVKEGYSWVPTKGLGSELLSELVGLWLKAGKKPTLGQLMSSSSKSKDFE